MFSPVSVCPSVSAWFMLSKIVFDGFYSNFAYTCISWVNGLGLLMSKFCQFLIELSDPKCPYFRFQTITSKFEWIFTKLGMCIDNMEI